MEIEFYRQTEYRSCFRIYIDRQIVAYSAFFCRDEEHAILKRLDEFKGGLRSEITGVDGRYGWEIYDIFGILLSSEGYFSSFENAQDTVGRVAKLLSNRGARK